MPKHSSVPIPRDRSLPFAKLVDWQAEHNPTYAYAVLASPKPEDETVLRVNYHELGNAVHRAAHIINPIVNGAGTRAPGTVIGVLAVADAIVYQALVLAVMRSGNTPFPISNRLPAVAVTHLLEKSRCHHIIMDSATATSDMFSAVQAEAATKDYALEVIPLPATAAIFPELGVESLSAPPASGFYPDVSQRPATETHLILHSSGSTGLPKPIEHNENFLQSSLLCDVYVDFQTESVTAAFPLPCFHMMGFLVQIVMAIGQCTPIGLWIPSLATPAAPPPPPTPELTMQSAMRVNSGVMIVVPSFIVEWIRDPAAVDFMAKQEYVVYSGGPLPLEVGDKLVGKGATLVSVAGSTEGALPTRLKSAVRETHEWPWMTFSKDYNLSFVPQENDANDAFELVLLEGPMHQPSVFNHTFEDGSKGYATKDLYVKHPTKDLWRIVGRIDDQLALVNGEKVNPGPLQDIIMENPFVDGAIVVGRGMTQVAVLVEPARGYTVDPSNVEELAAFRNIIWPTVDRANKSSAAFARIFKEAIWPISHDKPFPRTPKGTIPYKQAVNMFEAEIASLYEALDKAKAAVVPPESWDETALTAWLSKSLGDILETKIEPTIDIFEQGADSLTATYFRNHLVGAMRASGVETLQKAAADIDQNIIFGYPTIVALAAHISALTSGSASKLGGRLEDMAKLIGRYTTEYRPKERVLLTGSTGALGSYILSMLLADDRIEKVWAVNRPSKTSILDRHIEAFTSKGLDAELLRNSDKIEYVEAALASSQLGVSSEQYQKLSSATIVIHNAWRLDFNITVNSFESQIKGTRNLIDLLLTAPNPQARFYFTSSVGTMLLWPDLNTPAPEAPITDPSIVGNYGYGESKYVAEKLLEYTSAHTGIKTSNLRLGQLSGGRDGFWSPTDWVPNLIASSLSLGCLPNTPGTLSWLGLDDAAKSILEIALNTDVPVEQTLHICHPKPTAWSSIFESVATALSKLTGRAPLPLVPYAEWVGKLRAVPANEAEKVPALKLLSFWAGLEQGDQAALTLEKSHAESREAFASVMMSTEKSTGLSSTLQSVEPISPTNVGKWVEFWATKGLFGDKF